MVAVAVTCHSRVGVDLEYIRTGFDPFELAERIFSKSDLKIFQGLPEREKLAAFFRAWTRKEAYLKALGEGITEALEQISVSFGPEESAVICDTRNDASSQSWRLHILPLPADYIGSLACDASDKAAEIQRVRFVKDELVVESAQA
jgi:4'-phosphopantetheinyl transferase